MPVEVAVHLSDDGAYRPPVSRLESPCPPQTIISVPVQTAVWNMRADGHLPTVEVAVHVSDDGVYRPPVFW
jgi:hypothetical protein